MTTAACYVMAGVYEDCTDFITNFVQEASYDFDTFKKVWDRTEFIQIYSGRPTVPEMKYFTKELLIIAKKFALSKCTNFEKSGGIYLMFCLFMLQPLKNKVRIRIKYDELKELVEFVDQIKNTSLQVAFCFYKLLNENGFDFVYSEIPFSKERQKYEETLSTRDQNAIFEKREDEKQKFHDVLKTCKFDAEDWLKDERTLNNYKEELNKLLPSSITKFEIDNFLAPEPVKQLPHRSNVKYNSKNTRRKNRAYIQNKIERGLSDSEKEVEEQPETSNTQACSLPIIFDSCDEASD